MNYSKSEQSKTQLQGKFLEFLKSICLYQWLIYFFKADCCTWTFLSAENLIQYGVWFCFCFFLVEFDGTNSRTEQKLKTTATELSNEEGSIFISLQWIRSYCAAQKYHTIYQISFSALDIYWSTKHYLMIQFSEKWHIKLTSMQQNKMYIHTYIFSRGKKQIYAATGYFSSNPWACCPFLRPIG